MSDYLVVLIYRHLVAAAAAAMLWGKSNAASAWKCHIIDIEVLHF